MSEAILVKKQLFDHWLPMLASQVGGVAGIVVVVDEAIQGDWGDMICWPISATPIDGGLAKMAQEALVADNCLPRVVDHSGVGEENGLCCLACPLVWQGQRLGAVAVECHHVTDEGRIIVELEHGTTWLAALFGFAHAGPWSSFAALLEMVAASLEYDNLPAAATAVASLLAGRFGCELVSIGLSQGGGQKIIALSHSADFDSRTSLLVARRQAMVEAGDQQQCLVYPPLEDNNFVVGRAQERLAREDGIGAVCTVPMVDGGRIVGVILLERDEDRPFPQEEVEEIEQVVTLLGAVLKLRRENELWLPGKMMAAVRDFGGRLFGPRHPRFKALAVLLVMAVGLPLVLTGNLRVVGTAILEGEIQRAVIAPQDGFVGSSQARAGDVVRPGQLLATMDDRDFLLEEQKWASQCGQLRKEYRHALANHKQAQANIFKARIAQAQAQMALVEKELARARLVAPIAGLVIQGDLSQSIGAPVARGEVLFTVAPLAAYRLIMQIDERDIGLVRAGQRGDLLLAAAVDRPISFTIGRITPVSISAKGRNYFRVEGRLAAQPSFLRPGMEGVAKINCGQRSWFWLATHRLHDWFRVLLWRWLP